MRPLVLTRTTVAGGGPRMRSKPPPICEVLWSTIPLLPPPIRKRGGRLRDFMYT